MKMTAMKMAVIGSLFVIMTLAGGQSQLVDDTLFIGAATGSRGEQVVIPVYIKTSVYYQGWQIPVKFGSGTAPVRCDSVSLQNSCMNHYPHEWDFKAAFKNNNEWSGVQTCGVAGVADLYPPYQTLPPGYWLVMDLFYTIDSAALDQEIGIDTTTCSWYPGGPLNAYVVSVNAESYVTVVIPGMITVMNTAVEEAGTAHAAPGIVVYPTILSPGVELIARAAEPGPGNVIFKIADITGRAVRSGSCARTGACVMKLNGMSQGVYLVIARDGSGAMIGRQKIVVR